METSANVTAAVGEEARRLEDALDAARTRGDWRAEIDASAELLMFSIDNADVLGFEATSARVDHLAGDIVARVDSVLGSDSAPDDADARAELERTKVSVDALVRSFKALRLSSDVRAAMASVTLVCRAGDVEGARKAASALEAASRDYLASTAGPTEGWPDELRLKNERQRAQALVYLNSSSELLAANPQHPRQLEAYQKLLEVRLESLKTGEQIDAIRRDVHTGLLRRRAVNFVALRLALVSVRLGKRTERMYARSMAHPPRSAALHEKARGERRAAVASFERAEEHRQESAAALAAPVGSSWVFGVVQFLIGWAILGLALAVNYIVFASFDSNYFGWYLAHGALISIVFGFVSLAVRLDDYPDLISSNPLRYLYACLTLSLHLALAWNQVVAVDPERSAGLLLSKLFDLVVSLLAWVCVSVAFVGWLLIVAPIQHIPYAVLGAPARNALRNPARPQFDPEINKTFPSYDPDTDTPQSADDSGKGHLIGYAEKPVTLTSAFTAAVLWILSQFV